MSIDQMIEWFDIADVNKGAARFDIKKLEALNGHYIRNSGNERLVEALIALFPEMEGGSFFSDRLTDDVRRKLVVAMPSIKERARTLVDLADGARFLFDMRPLKNENKAEKILADGGRAVLAEVLPRLEALDEWDVELLETLVRDFAEAADLKLGKVAQPVRAALTARTTAPSVAEVLAVLGKDEALARISDQLA